MKYLCIRIANICTWLSGRLNSISEWCLNEATRLHAEDEKYY